MVGSTFLCTIGLDALLWGLRFSWTWVCALVIPWAVHILILSCLLWCAMLVMLIIWSTSNQRYPGGVWLDHAVTQGEIILRGVKQRIGTSIVGVRFNDEIEDLVRRGPTHWRPALLKIAHRWAAMPPGKLALPQRAADGLLTAISKFPIASSNEQQHLVISLSATRTASIQTLKLVVSAVWAAPLVTYRSVAPIIFDSLFIGSIGFAHRFPLIDMIVLLWFTLWIFLPDYHIWLLAIGIGWFCQHDLDSDIIENNNTLRYDPADGVISLVRECWTLADNAGASGPQWYPSLQPLPEPPARCTTAELDAAFDRPSPVQHLRLQVQGHGGRYFGVGVTGQQKVGKSTLVRNTFGPPFQSGVERTTRGIDAAACRMQNEQPFMVFDIEGLGGSERAGQYRRELAATATDVERAATDWTSNRMELELTVAGAVISPILIIMLNASDLNLRHTFTRQLMKGISVLPRRLSTPSIVFVIRHPHEDTTDTERLRESLCSRLTAMIDEDITDRDGHDRAMQVVRSSRIFIVCNNAESALYQQQTATLKEMLIHPWYGCNAGSIDTIQHVPWLLRGLRNDPTMAAVLLAQTTPPPPPIDQAAITTLPPAPALPAGAPDAQWQDTDLDQPLIVAALIAAQIEYLRGLDLNDPFAMSTGADVQQREDQARHRLMEVLTCGARPLNSDTRDHVELQFIVMITRWRLLLQPCGEAVSYCAALPGHTHHTCSFNRMPHAQHRHHIVTTGCDICNPGLTRRLCTDSDCTPGLALLLLLLYFSTLSSDSPF
jgi:hypothetical protein